MQDPAALLRPDPFRKQPTRAAMPFPTHNPVSPPRLGRAWLLPMGLRLISLLALGAFLPFLGVPAAEPQSAAPRPAKQKHVVMIIAEDEYDAKETLPRFAKEVLTPRGIQVTILRNNPKDRNDIPGLRALRHADLAILFVRRRALPKGQLAEFRRYLDRGGALLALRTASHAFDARGQGPSGHQEWKAFDRDVLGGNYHGHHPNGPLTSVHVVPGMAAHPVLKDVAPEGLKSRGSLYQTSPLSFDAQVILFGTIKGAAPEPILWTRRCGPSRVVYTSLGHPDDFRHPAFVKLLENAVFFALKPRT